MTFQKVFPKDLVLESERIQMRLLKEDDYEHFLPISRSTSIWTYFTKDLSKVSELLLWIDDALMDYTAERRFPFTIVDKKTGCICGSSSFGNISFFDRRIEIGWTWIGEEFMGTGINTDAKYLLLKYAFENLDFIRVELKTDNLNERAKKALQKIGAVPEGVLRSHMQMFNNRRRDSIYYSILRPEWEILKHSTFKELCSANDITDAEI